MIQRHKPQQAKNGQRCNLKITGSQLDYEKVQLVPSKAHKAFKDMKCKKKT